MESLAPPKGIESLLMLCPQCNRETLAGRHCKLLCLACGYVESCEDNFVVDAASRERIGVEPARC